MGFFGILWDSLGFFGFLKEVIDGCLKLIGKSQLKDGGWRRRRRGDTSLNQVDYIKLIKTSWLHQTQTETGGICYFYTNEREKSGIFFSFHFLWGKGSQTATRWGTSRRAGSFGRRPPPSPTSPASMASVANSVGARHWQQQLQQPASAQLFPSLL